MRVKGGAIGARLHHTHPKHQLLTLLDHCEILVFSSDNISRAILGGVVQINNGVAKCGTPVPTPYRNASNSLMVLLLNTTYLANKI